MALAARSGPRRQTTGGGAGKDPDPEDDVFERERERWGLMKIPRGDIDGVGEDEATVTSGLHAQAERTNKQRRDGYIRWRLKTPLRPRSEDR